MARERKLSFPKEAGLARGARGREVGALQEFLARFGYLRMEDPGEYAPLRQLRQEPEATPERFDEATEDALLAYQRFHGLPGSRELDDATVAQMSQPRCGFPDVSRDGVAPFVAQGSKWKTNRLKYKFLNFSPDVPRAKTRTAVEKALQLWSAVTPLRFREVGKAQEAEIRIRFVKGSHGDGFPFDGLGGVLAHAFYPPPNGGALAGDAHFDEVETWSVAIPVPPQRFDLVTVAAHEFGHSLGLAHSTVGGALMYPSYNGPHRFLHQDDVQGIRDIYGA